MMSRLLLLLSLAVVLLAYGSQAQTCGPCIKSCHNGTCCEWDDPPIDTDPASLVGFNKSPLGFTLAFMPRIESADPKPCVLVYIEEPSQTTYIQVAIESTTDICVHDGNSAEQSCGMAVYFCKTAGYRNQNFVEFQFDCTSCPASDTAFYFRVEMETVGADDELWCERTDRSLPSDLNQNMNTAFTPSDISQPDLVTLAAPTILVTPLFLLISALIVTLRV